jgi:glycosyltransferase involved in cell wall biosynthesis
MTDGDPLVSVVVPAFNAAKTIHETLHSISQQTYRTLEVVVVDDGSTDETAAIAYTHSFADPRFRVVSKPNAGVASARNEGIRTSRGEFIAFIDADDLWHPTKIEKQLDVLMSGGPDTALVYSPFRLIGADGNVIASPHKYGVNGWVLYRHFYTNLVGNGSALLIRRKVLEEFGGFDPWLRDQGAEGCEDLLLQLRIAARYRFGEVSEYLVGYRRLPDNMSSNTEQMIRSGVLAVSRALSECRDIPGLSAAAMLRRYEWQRLKTSMRKGRMANALRIFGQLLTESPSFVGGALWKECCALANKGRSIANDGTQRLGRPKTSKSPPHFYDLDPKSGIDLSHDTPTSRALCRLARFDQAYRPKAYADQPRGLRSDLGRSSDEITQSETDTVAFRCSCTYQKGEA